MCVDSVVFGIYVWDEMVENKWIGAPFLDGQFETPTVGIICKLAHGDWIIVLAVGSRWFKVKRHLTLLLLLRHNGTPYQSLHKRHKKILFYNKNNLCKGCTKLNYFIYRNMTLPKRDILHCFLNLSFKKFQSIGILPKPWRGGMNNSYSYWLLFFF